MPLGTLDRSPPPFFKQGPSSLTQLVFLSALALFLMAADTRFGMTGPLRSAVSTALLPVQQLMHLPVQAWERGLAHWSTVDEVRAREREAESALVMQAERAARLSRLEAENEALRQLLALRPMLPQRHLAAEVLHQAADAFSRKVVIDRGALHGVLPGSPAVDAQGVIGQVTRVHPLTAEITLLTDRDAALPVLNTRTGLRAAAFGDPASAGSGGGLELRFMPGNGDLEPGDRLETSGIDGIYPPGLPVATIRTVERRTGATFAKVVLQPVARPDRVRLLLVLEPLNAERARQAEAAAALPPGAPVASRPAAAAASAASAASRPAGLRPPSRAAGGAP